MRFTLSWLKDYLDTNLTVKEIEKILTDIGLEVENITDLSISLNDFIIAEIIAAEPHPNANKLKVCKVNDGSNILQIVCGASNARKGIKVVLAPLGSIIPANGMKIKASKIRDVESSGMLCSDEELGLAQISEGIKELPGNAPIGKKFVEFSELDDPVIEIGLTPNRGDCLGVYGIARDLAAAGAGRLKPLDINQYQGQYNAKMTITINNLNNCPAFLARHFRNVKNKPSPSWLQNRLKSIGINPVSALVDITNYISYSFARPLHVYDASKIIGDNLIVRGAIAGEEFNALDSKSYKLKGGETIITDNSNILALGGVIGGLDSSCSIETKELWLESALFNPTNIAYTGRTHQIDSDARYRFERSVDPEFIAKGVELATQMIIDICGGEASDIISSGEIANAQKYINFDINQVKRYTGLNIAKERMIEILYNLGFIINEDTDHMLKLQVPSWRNDINENIDIVEEILRIYGYDKLILTPLPELSLNAKPALDYTQYKDRVCRRILAARGMNEVVTWSFMSSEKAQYFHDINEKLKVLNPINTGLDVMRSTILPNLIDIIRKNNLRNFYNLAFFEVGPIFYTNMPTDQGICIAGVRSGEDHEKNHYKEVRKIDLYDVKADIIALIKEYGLNIDSIKFVENAPKYYHPFRSATIKLGNKIIGYFGEIHPKIIQIFDIKDKIQSFELFVDELPNIKFKQKLASLEVSDYQIVNRDFAFIIEQDQPAIDLIKAIRATDNNLIKLVNIFDIYQGQGIDHNKKSIAINVQMQASNRTLTEEEINQISSKIIINTKKIGAILRE